MQERPIIKGVDTDKAIETIGGNVDSYIEMLGGFRRDIMTQINLIRENVQLPDLKEFVILVHGIKGSSRMLGMDKLGEEMYQLEIAGKAGDRGYISENLDRVLAEYQEYDSLLEQFDARSKQDTVGAISEDDARFVLQKMKAALEDFESETAEELVRELGKYSFSGNAQEIYGHLLSAIDNFDYFDSIEQVNKLMEVI